MGIFGRRLLLVKPPYRHLPIGLSFVAAALAKNNIDFDFLDYSADKTPDLQGKLRSGDYFAVASGGLVASFGFFKNFFKAVKTAAPAMPCILGGNITSNVDLMLLFSSIPIDYAVIGEAEKTFPELLTLLALQRTKREDIEGIAFRTGSGAGPGVARTKPRPRLDLLSENWMSDWSFLDLSHYPVPADILTGRGCVGRCSFCSPTLGRFRPRSIDFVLEEIEGLRSRYNIDSIYFRNEILFPTEEMIYAFCERYKRLKPALPWRCQLRVDFRPDVLRAMRDAGCYWIGVGLESGSDTVLKAMQKDTSVAQIKGFIEGAKAAGISLGCAFMVGNYEETAEDVRRTVDLMADMKVGGGGGRSSPLCHVSGNPELSEGESTRPDSRRGSVPRVAWPGIRPFPFCDHVQTPLAKRSVPERERHDRR